VYKRQLLDDAVGNIGYPVDVIVMRTERFERTKRAASRRKYLKALLTRYQIEFPKTHDIKTLPRLAGSASGPVAETVTGASWLTPIGVEIRYPGETAGMLPGEEPRPLRSQAVTAGRACDPGRRLTSAPE